MKAQNPGWICKCCGYMNHPEIHVCAHCGTLSHWRTA